MHAGACLGACRRAGRVSELVRRGDRYFLGIVRNTYTLAQLRSGLDGFTVEGFKKEAAGLHDEISRLLAKGDLTKLRHLAASKELGNTSREMKQREAGGWRDIKWARESLGCPTPSVA